MKDFTGIAATLKADRNGNTNTKQLLDAFNDHLDNITAMFDPRKPVGKVLRAEVNDNDELVVQGIIEDEYLEMGGFHIAIAYKVVEGSHGRGYVPMGYGITRTPSDTGTTEIKEIK